MKASNLHWTRQQGWSAADSAPSAPQLALFFGSRSIIEDGAALTSLKMAFPNAKVVGCSTGGQIIHGNVCDDVAVALVLQFDKTPVLATQGMVIDNSESAAVGRRLGDDLLRPDLKGIFVLSDGLKINGSKLIQGLRSVVGDDIVITGGLAGDGASFERTIVIANNEPCEGQIAAVGFYGNAITIGHGSAGGWDEFGPKRRITKSTGNLLCELDGKPALDLYKSYLGEEAQGLPGTALLYPLLVSDPANAYHAVVRTVLSVDHDNATMTFAGDVPEGWTAQLMRGHFDRLAEGAAKAARSAAVAPIQECSDVAAVLVSCIGRRLLMGESIIDEISAAQRELGAATSSVGFYSYGEICPHSASGYCELHNQTMTVTTFSEAA